MAAASGLLPSADTNLCIASNLQRAMFTNTRRKTVFKMVLECVHVVSLLLLVH